jgi:hypothetical protein
MSFSAIVILFCFGFTAKKIFCEENIGENSGLRLRLKYSGKYYFGGEIRSPAWSPRHMILRDMDMFRMCENSRLSILQFFAIRGSPSAVA